MGLLKGANYNYEIETEIETLGPWFSRLRLRLRPWICIFRDRDRDWDLRISRESRKFEILVCLWFVHPIVWNGWLYMTERLRIKWNDVLLEVAYPNIGTAINHLSRQLSPFRTRQLTGLVGMAHIKFKITRRKGHLAVFLLAPAPR